jgi:hypothetical protein
MRLREREKRTLTVRLPEEGALSEDVIAWGEGFEIRAAIYPNGREIDVKLYGERVNDMRLMLYEGAKALDVGMGVCVDVSDGVPDYRIIRIEQWAHTRATLEKIPDGRRI